MLLFTSILSTSPSSAQLRLLRSLIEYLSSRISTARYFIEMKEFFLHSIDQVIGISTDSHFSHLAWINQPRKQGGLGGLNYPLVSDFNKSISKDYGVLIEEAGIALRGLFIIDPTGVVRQMSINDLPVGRSVDETLRLLVTCMTTF